MNPNHSEIYFRTILKHLFWSQYLIIGNSNIGANPSKDFSETIQSEWIRTISKSISKPFWNTPNQSEKHFKSCLMWIGKKFIQINPIQYVSIQGINTNEFEPIF